MIETAKIESEKFRLSCSLYEMIEIWSMRGHEVELKYIDENQKEQNITAVISNIFSREGLEQMEINGNQIIPTKNIILVNDVPFRDYLK